VHNSKLGTIDVVNDITVDLTKLLHHVIHTTLQYVVGNAVKQINQLTYYKICSEMNDIIYP